MKSKARNAVTYSHVCGPELRPRGTMAIERHQEVGRLIKSVLAATPGHKGIRHCLNMIQGDLDEWVMRECAKDELPQPTFLDLYYGEEAREPVGPMDREELVERVERVKKILVSCYPDCDPLRCLLRFADQVITMIRKRRATSDARRRKLPSTLVRTQIPI